MLQLHRGARRAVASPRTAALAAVVLGLLAAGCGGSPALPGAISRGGSSATATPTPEPTLPQPPPLSWQDCGARFQCATLLVPLDYSRPDSGQLHIALIRRPASDPSSRIGSLVLNPGGPGGSGIKFLREIVAIFPSELTRRFDLVSFDPRGVGASDPLECLTDAQLDQVVAADSRDQLVQTSKQLADACSQKGARLLPHIGTSDVVRDMDELRAGLGDQKLTYMGFSYGTQLGAEYADMFPSHVRALALDGALDPTLTAEQLTSQYAMGFEGNLSDFLGFCQQLTGALCPLGGDVTGERQRLIQFLGGLQSKPIQLPDGRVLNRALATAGVDAGLFSGQEGWPVLLQAIQDGLAGNGAPLARLADELTGRDQAGHFDHSIESNTAVTCIDRSWPREASAYDTLARQLAGQAPVFGEEFALGNLPCAYWPASTVGIAHPVHARGAPALLVVGTTRDPATPYPWAQSLSSQLGATLLTYDDDGHTAYIRGGRCIQGPVDDYLINLHAPGQGTRCDARLGL